jgi:asparagine synthase (glutamine-hydrolysing)
MGGIAGIVSFRPGRGTRRETVARMVGAMPHRAHDGNAILDAGEAVLGAAWLSTTGEPRPPVARLANALFICADCRLDDREELMAALGLRDHGVTDPELLLRAYLKWDEACVLRLRGDFAFAIWDSERSSLFCARDHFGVRPFHYAADGNRFVFASEIRPILLATGTRPRLNDAVVAGYLAGMPGDAEATSFDGISRLPAGHTITFRNGCGEARQYWRPEPGARAVGRDRAEEFGHIFARSVANRQRGQGPVATMLSGGLDSSSIACVAAGQQRRRGAEALRTYSLVFPHDPHLDERRFIEAVLATGGMTGRLIASGAQQPFDGFEKVLDEQEGIFLAPGLALTRPVYEAARDDGVRVMLNGHGGDEVVSHAYMRLVELACSGRWMELWRETRGVGSIHGTSGIATFLRLAASFGLGGRTARAVRVFQRAGRRLSSGKFAGGPAWSAIVNRDLARSTGLSERYSAAALPPPRARIDESLHHRWQLARGLNAHAFEVLGRASAAFGIEERYPFWDKDLVEFCLSLPAEEKLSGGWSRLVLRRAMEGVLPPVVQWRRDKIDFTQSLVGGMLENHGPLLEATFGAEAERIAGYVDIPGIRAAYSRLRANPQTVKIDDVLHVWRTVSLSIWLRQLDARGGLQ